MDRSLTRAVVIKGLVMHGYPDEEIVVIAEHILDWGHREEKGAAWFLTDVCRLIAKYRAELPAIAINATVLRKATRPRKGEKRARSARQPKKKCRNADELLAYYREHRDAGALVFRSRQEVAGELGISLPTLDRYERQLRERRAIMRVTSSSRRDSWVEILEPQEPEPPAPEVSTSAVSSASEDVLGVIRRAENHSRSPGDEVLSAVTVSGSGIADTPATTHIKEHRPRAAGKSARPGISAMALICRAGANCPIHRGYVRRKGVRRYDTNAEGAWRMQVRERAYPADSCAAAEADDVLTIERC
ncbi:hypothetical protein K2Z83_16965 [Oscillochloris sp. ZM17-4]|nr:hypothetical protein [Oscillochloris sp. ZM17-4]